MTDFWSPDPNGVLPTDAVIKYEALEMPAWATQPESFRGYLMTLDDLELVMLRADAIIYDDKETKANCDAELRRRSQLKT